MKASEILEHIIDAWASKASSTDQKLALGLVRLYVGKAKRLLGDFEVDVRWSPPKGDGDAGPTP